MRRYRVNQLVRKFFYVGVHRDGMRAIFWGNTLRQFAATAVGLYVPVFVYKIGLEVYGGTMAAGLRALIVFLIVARVAIIVMSLFVEQIIDKIGFRWTFLLSSLFLFLKFVLLSLSRSNLVFLWFAAVVSGIVTATHWIARHALFGEDQNETSVGTTLGFIIVLSRIAAVVGPVLGGYIALLFGFTGLFHFGLVLVVLSSIPYFFMKHHRRHNPDGLSGLLDKIRDRNNFPLMVAWIGRSWDDELSCNFWPLYIFVVLGAVEKLGIVTSAVAVVSMAVAFIAGKIFDRSHRKKRIFILGAVITAIIWPLKALAKGFGSIFIIDSMYAMLGSFYWIPFQSQIYRFSFRRDTVAFFAFREIVLSLGIMLFLTLVFLITFSWSWTLIFLLGGLGIVMSMNLVSYRGFR